LPPTIHSRSDLPDPAGPSASRGLPQDTPCAAESAIFPRVWTAANNRRLFYLFDYGDNWIFQINRARNKPFAPEPGTEWPRLISKRGEKPPQYPEPDYTIQSP
jgi:hypothetical protein